MRLKRSPIKNSPDNKSGGKKEVKSKLKRTSIVATRDGWAAGRSEKAHPRVRGSAGEPAHVDSKFTFLGPKGRRSNMNDNKVLWVAVLAAIAAAVLGLILVTRPSGVSQEEMIAAVKPALEAAKQSNVVGDTNTNKLDALTPKVDALGTSLGTVSTNVDTMAPKLDAVVAAQSGMSDTISSTVAAQIAPLSGKIDAAVAAANLAAQAADNAAMANDPIFNITLEGPEPDFLDEGSTALFTVTTDIANATYQYLWSVDGGELTVGGPNFSVQATNTTTDSIGLSVKVIVMSQVLGGSRVADTDRGIFANPCTVFKALTYGDLFAYSPDKLQAAAQEACGSSYVLPGFMPGASLTTTVGASGAVTMTANYISWAEDAIPQMPAAQKPIGIAAAFWRIPAQVTQAQYEGAFAKTWDLAKLVGAETYQGKELTLDQNIGWLVYCADSRKTDQPADVSDVLEVKYLSNTTFARAYIQVPFDPRVPPRSDNTWIGCTGSDFYAIRLNN